ncbi:MULTISPECIES: TolB family protein [unclassified Streptomyces]|uniref:TolB family protein n=1 Tax=unclassified Streptomyces TaxID=2593676 RepID=UPI0035D649DF
MSAGFPSPATPLRPRTRIAVVVAAVLLLVGGSVGYALHAKHRSDGRRGVADASFTLGGPALYFRDTATGRVAHQPLVGAPGGRGPDTRTTGGPVCERFYAAGDTGLCLRAEPGVLPKTYAIVLDGRLREKRRVTIPGVPTRARVSASGRMLSWTVFATGDSYATTAFSTRTAVLDLRTGYLIKSMEDIPLTIDGARYHAPDVNYWGVTFARDDSRFYATVSTKGRTYLVEGNMSDWSAKALRKNVECPSLSPDNTRIAFKKKVSDDPAAPWRLYVLDLRTMRETPLAERRSVDDQAAWLDDGTVAYALPGGAGRASDIWTVPADGTGKPRVAVAGGSSPVAVG